MHISISKDNRKVLLTYLVGILSISAAGCSLFQNSGAESQPATGANQLGKVSTLSEGPSEATILPTKLGDVVRTGKTGIAPTSGYYYVTVMTSPDSDVDLPRNSCVDQSFWTFVRRFFGANPSSASAILTVTVTPSGAPGQALTVPVFSTIANTVNSSGAGSNCQTEYLQRPLTFTFNSNQNPTFDVDMAFHLSNSTTSNLVTTVLADASTLMSLMAAGSATPAALAALANPQIQTLATSIDSAVNSNWTNSNDLKFHTVLDPGETGGQVVDLIRFKMPSLRSSGGGAGVGSSWDAGGTISLSYSKEKFKSLGQWQDYNTVLTDVIVPSTTPSAQTTLYQIVLNGTATGGFKLSGLNSASTTDSLINACSDLERFLASSLIPDDALVARFAILKGSPYEKLPDLRANSNCFTDQELSKLRSFRSDYVFSDQQRENPNLRSLNDKMNPVTTALLLQNPQVIASIVADPPTSFYVALSKDADDYYHGQVGINKLSGVHIQLSCYHARPNNDLSSIAVLVTYNSAKTGGIVSFDANNKFASLVLMSPDDVVSATGIAESSWLSATAPVPTCATSS